MLGGQGLLVVRFKNTLAAFGVNASGGPRLQHVLGNDVFQVPPRKVIPHVLDEFVDAIESGNMDTLPDMCYTTGFLKTYCELLDLDAEAGHQEANSRA